MRVATLSGCGYRSSPVGGVDDFGAVAREQRCNDFDIHIGREQMCRSVALSRNRSGMESFGGATNAIANVMLHTVCRFEASRYDQSYD